MPDYVINISASSQMMVRDTGGWVEFWFHTGPQSWNNDQQYSYGANGVGSGIRKFRLVRGGNWQFVASVYITYNQDISWTIYGAGIGFPTTTQTQHIQRSTVPQAPTLLTAVPFSATSFAITWRVNYDGGSGIVEQQLGYGQSSNGPTNTAGISGDDETIGGFSPGQSMYFWVRVRNGDGWSPWSNRLQATTWQVPAAPGQASFVGITQKSAGVNYPFTVRPNNPPNLEKQFKYGRDITGAVIDATVTVDETTEYLSGLDAGGTYYFWARARNSVGWGPWSTTSSKLVLIAGSRVMVGGMWSRAVPYVNVGGTWKVAEPWIKDAGVWKKTLI